MGVDARGDVLGGHVVLVVVLGATAALGLQPGERVAGVVLMGTPREPPLERERPLLEPLVTRWEP